LWQGTHYKQGQKTWKTEATLRCCGRSSGSQQHGWLSLFVFFPMKKCLLLLPLLALAVPAAAQHTDIIGRAGAGLLRFGGENAQRVSSVYYFDGEKNGFTSTSYGGRQGAGIALGGRVQRVAAQQGLLALDLGYEWLQSRTAVTAVDYAAFSYSSSRGGPYAATGHTALQNQNLTVFLGLGRRFTAGIVEVDALVGPEGAYVFDFREKGSGTYDGGKDWSTNRKYLKDSRGDVRLRADATAWVHRVGLNASYSYGLLNYYGKLTGAEPEAYSRTLRLGLAYQLR
jgi:hypothetical protein